MSSNTTSIIREICCQGQNVQYNVVMPVVYRDFSFLKKTIRYIFANLAPKKIFLLVDTRYKKFLPSEIRKEKKCEIIDENQVLEGLSYIKIESLLMSQKRHHSKPGWYFQQFLKMAFALNRRCDTDYYLVWDSDTIPLRPISFFDENGHPFFTMKHEYHKPYFDTICRLLDLKKNNQKSYISEHMMFNRNVMIELINRISVSGVKGEFWYEKIINSLVDETISPFSFSEFETYGSFCNFYYPSLYVERQLPGIREGGLIQGRFISDRILRNLAADMYIATFEIYDRPPQPWKFICALYEKYQKYKVIWIRKLVGSKFFFDK